MEGTALVELLAPDSSPVATVTVPAFRTPPAVLLWRGRDFGRDTEGRYRARTGDRSLMRNLTGHYGQEFTWEVS